MIVVATDRCADGSGGAMALGPRIGAMALGHADRLFMLSAPAFSLISPEGAAAILYWDTSRADELVGPLRLTSAKLTGPGIAANPAPADPSPANLGTADPGTEPATRC